MRKIQFWSLVASPEEKSPKSGGSFTIHHLYSIISTLLSLLYTLLSLISFILCALFFMLYYLSSPLF